MKKILAGILVAAFLFSCNNETPDDKATTTTEATPVSASDKKPAAALLDVSEADAVKKSFEAFANGDIDGMASVYDDSVRYYFSSGDSLVGKQAVAGYYKGRRSLIDAIKFTDQIVLPVQVNEPQTKNVQPGKWILYWTKADVKYTNGKKIVFWFHNVNHYNDAGKIDFANQYIDMAPIREATKGMVIK